MSEESTAKDLDYELKEREVNVSEAHLELEKRETSVKEQELLLQRKELALKEEEIARSKWLNPVALGIFAAAASVLGSIYSARVNSQNQINMERMKEESSTFTTAINTGGDPLTACNNLVKLIEMGQIRDPSGKIRACEIAPQYTPVLGQAPKRGTDSAAEIPEKGGEGMSIPANRPRPASPRPAATPGSSQSLSLSSDAQAKLSQLQLRYNQPGLLHKAMAISQGGHGAIFIQQADSETAAQKAMAACQTFAGPFDPCTLVYIDDEAVAAKTIKAPSSPR